VRLYVAHWSACLNDRLTSYGLQQLAAFSGSVAGSCPAQLAQAA